MTCRTERTPADPRSPPCTSGHTNPLDRYRTRSAATFVTGSVKLPNGRCRNDQNLRKLNRPGYSRGSRKPRPIQRVFSDQVVTGQNASGSNESSRGVGVSPNGGMNSRLSLQAILRTSWSKRLITSRISMRDHMGPCMSTNCHR